MRYQELCHLALEHIKVLQREGIPFKNEEMKQIAVLTTQLCNILMGTSLLCMQPHPYSKYYSYGIASGLSALQSQIKKYNIPDAIVSEIINFLMIYQHRA